MASNLDFVEYVVQQLQPFGFISYRKMFGEFCIYIEFKPVILVCDNTPFIKKIDCIKELAKNLNLGFPYNGAKEHYVLDIDDKVLLEELMPILIENIPLPKKK